MALSARFCGVVAWRKSPSIIGEVSCFGLIRTGSLPWKSIPAIPRGFGFFCCREIASSGSDEGGLRVRLEHWLYTIPLRVRSIFRRAQVERELEEELRFHLEQLI